MMKASVPVAEMGGFSCKITSKMENDVDTDFEQHLLRLRAGEVEAIDEFVAKYEAFIRRSLRFRLQHSNLQPVADSVDVCQSVMGSVLLRLMAGEYSLHSEVDLRGLLMGIAQKKFLILARHESADKRSRTRTRYLQDFPEPAATRVDDPSQPLICAELLAEVAKRLSPHEAELFRLRREGLSWEAISAAAGEESSILRKRLSRALRCIAGELGMA